MNMMSTTRSAAGAALLILATALANANGPRPDVVLRALFAASDEASLQRNPLEALARGDLRYADRFGDYLSDAYFAAEGRAAAADLAALARIDRSALDAEDRISYDVFQFQRGDDLRASGADFVGSQRDRPLEHFFGMQTVVPDMSSGNGISPFKTVADYENNLKRLDGYVTYLDRAIAGMRRGIADGITNPYLVMEHVAAQFDALIAEGVEGSTFYKPVRRFPETIPAVDRTRLSLAYGQFIRTRLIPAHVRMRDFLKVEYLPRARHSIGLGEIPGGARLYRHLIASSTTTDMAPDDIHSLGLSEVTRIHSAMRTLQRAVGFKGSEKRFAVFLRTDPRFAPASAAAMHTAFESIDRKVLASIARDFSLFPKSRLEIRPVPPYKEQTDAAGSYLDGAPDGSRPGIFYFNTFDLKSRYVWDYETLFLHEAIPGHHFQGSLAQENAALPAFQRFGGNTAFVEGWALYAESLGSELGMFTDPYQSYGHLNSEILRAMRLVVDTGIHARHWGRERAIAYMLDNSALSRTEVEAEVERYIAVPGQALSYKIGELTIRRLRARAEKELGSQFDVRAFHAQVLNSGALPLAVLQRKIEAWIATVKR